MTTVYCTHCWATYPYGATVCARCGAALQPHTTYVAGLIAALRHPEPSTPVRAANVLGLLRAREAAGALRAVLSQSEDPYLLQAAARALGAIGDREAIPELARVLRGGPLMARQAAVEALRCLGATEALAVLAEASRLDPSESVRERAAAAMGALQGVVQMLELEIPGWPRLKLEHLMLDVNGTLTLEGQLLPGVADRLTALRRVLRVHLLSADSYGRLDVIAAQVDAPATRLQPGRPEAQQKARLVRELGAARVVAIGNGANDEEMLRAAALGIAVMGPEGLAAGALWAADVLASSIQEALDLLLKPRRLVATLRR